MTRIEPDGMVPKWRNHLAPNPGMALVEEPAFVRSTILAAIDESRAQWDERDDVPLDSEASFRDRAYAQGFRDACDHIRARFHPTKGENGHE